MLPYTENILGSNLVERTFQEEVSQEDFLWHRDNEDRVVVSTTQTDWQIQLENKLPQSLNSEVFVARGEWHRVIKGTGELVVKIIKSNG